MVVLNEKGEWHVVLTGTKSMTYRALKVDDPLRLVVDLPNTINEMHQTPMAVNDEVIGTVKIAQLVHDPQPLTRVEIGLNKDMAFKVTRQGKELWISFKTTQPITDIESAKTERVVKRRAKIPLPPPETKAPQVADAPMGSTEESQQVVEEPLPPASKIIAIEPVEVEEDFDVHIVGDGRLNYYDVSLLNDPLRLVIDVIGVGSAEVKEVLTLNVPWVKKVRIGIHAIKVRVVFDLLFLPGAEIPFQINSEENRLVVSFEPSSDLTPR
jgi:hypothetical protein